jgi:DNA repair photolyase
MPLNKSTGNLYEFVTHSWNPIQGKCPHDCSYCYVERTFRRYGNMNIYSMEVIDV